MILHERAGGWARRLRSRINGVEIVWAETRTTAELLQAIAAVTAPVVLIEIGHDPENGLRDLAALRARSADALILAVMRANRPAVRELAQEFGADHVTMAVATPPEVADLLVRWIGLSANQIAREGWMRRPPADPIRDPVAWLANEVADAGRGGPSLES